MADLAVEFQTAEGPHLAVDGMSFDVANSEVLAIVGESGSGKSVTALSILGLLPTGIARVVRGEIRLGDTDLTRLSGAELSAIRGARISMVFQDPLSSLNPGLTVGYQVAEVFRRRAAQSKRAAWMNAVELMDRVRIPDARARARDYPHQFSGGMRQRIMIAMALALKPEVLIADEPTTALDVTVQQQILSLLREIQDQEGLAIVLISHDVGLVAGFADRVAVMYTGRVVEGGRTRDVLSQPAHPYTRGLMRSVPSLSRLSEQLWAIPGSPPNAARVPVGCSFHPRCYAARSRCEQEIPQYRAAAPERFSACHFAEEVLNEDSQERVNS